PTFDVKLDELLSRKRVLAGDMLNGSADISPGDFDISGVILGDSQTDVDERGTLDIAFQMDWEFFEWLANVLWTKRGYRCYQTPAHTDNGIDLVAIRGDQGELVQAKTSAAGGTRLSWDAVKEVVAGAAFYQQRHPKVAFSKVCITNQFFNDQARENAKLNGVELLDQTHVAEMLGRDPVTMLEIERVRFA